MRAQRSAEIKEKNFVKVYFFTKPAEIIWQARRIKGCIVFEGICYRLQVARDNLQVIDCA